MEKRIFRVTKLLFAVYAAFLVWIILFKLCLPGEPLPKLRSVNLIPFAGALTVNGRADYTEVLQNLIIFIPFGVYMGMLKPAAAFGKRLLPVFCASFALEALQYVCSLGASDITDLLSNTAGGAVGIGIYALFCAVCGKKAHRILNLIAAAATVCAAVFLFLLLAANR